MDRSTSSQYMNIFSSNPLSSLNFLIEIAKHAPLAQFVLSVVKQKYLGCLLGISMASKIHEFMSYLMASFESSVNESKKKAPSGLTHKYKKSSLFLPIWLAI